jgi:hypothetical protein
MNGKRWLQVAAGFSFFMAICQAVVSVFPDAAAYFKAPPPLLEDHLRLLLIGGGVALLFAIAGLYALSGAQSIPRLPLLRLGLIGISCIYLLRGLFLILSALVLLGVLEGELLVQGDISTLVFLAAGIAYTVGTRLNWRAMSRHFA